MNTANSYPVTKSGMDAIHGSRRLAPIALFVYNRPDHARQTLEALRQNMLAGDSDLVIFSDAPKVPSAEADVQNVRALLKCVSGFRSVTIVERDHNLGLAKSIISGVTNLVKDHGRVIVLEDDMITSPFFLKFMNDGLDRYDSEEQVISIHGYQYPVGAKLPETFFLRGTDCWGWATWRRGWDLFESDGRMLLQNLRDQNLTHRFDFDGSYPYTRMLEGQIKGKNDSWAIRWHASAFLKHKLTLHAGRSLVRNIGLDDSGVHCSTADEFTGAISDTPIAVEAIPVEENEAARKLIVEFHKTSRSSMPARLIRRLTGMARRAL